MNPNMSRLRAWLWWVVPFAALALLLGIETDWGRSFQRLPGPAPAIEPKPVAVALLPEYRVDGGLGAHAETVSRTLFNPTRRPAPAQTADNARSSMPKGKFVLTGTAVAGDRHIAFLKEVAGGKSRVVRQGDQINGVLVATVAVDRVRFTQGDDAEELVLKVAAGPKTTLPPPPPPAAAPPAPGGAPLPGAVPPATPAARQPAAGAANPLQETNASAVCGPWALPMRRPLRRRTAPAPLQPRRPERRRPRPQRRRPPRGPQPQLRRTRAGTTFLSACVSGAAVSEHPHAA